MSIPSAFQTVDDLVADVIRGARLPASQQTLTSTDLIALMDDEMKGSLTGIIHRVREDFWLYNYDQSITASVYSYAMPPRAVAGGLRDFVFVDASGNEIEIAHLDPDQLKTPAYYGYRPAFSTQGAFLQNDKLILWPQTYNNSAFTLRQKYERRPNTLTAVANCCQITAVNISAKTVQVNPVNADWLTSTTFDIIDNKPQFASQGDDLTITQISGTAPATITFTTLPSTVAVGMWLCPANLTCIPQIPVEAYSLLSNMGIRRAHMSMQNSNGFQVAAKVVEEGTQALTSMLTPRVQGSPRKIVQKNLRVGLPGNPFFR